MKPVFLKIRHIKPEKEMFTKIVPPQNAPDKEVHLEIHLRMASP